MYKLKRERRYKTKLTAVENTSPIKGPGVKKETGGEVKRTKERV